MSESDPAFILIGGSPSSGSSFLTRKLGMHPEILALPETGLFCHGAWLASRNSPPQGLQAHLPWLDTRVKLRQSLGWELSEAFASSPFSFSPFEFVRERLNGKQARVIVEKTPENVFAFEPWLKADPGNQAVVTYRHYRAVCESLVMRGFSSFESLLIWFAHAYECWRLAAAYPAQIFRSNFETLVRSTDDTLAALLRFFGIKTQHSPFRSKKDIERAFYSKLLEIPNWGLEDTSWSRRVDDTAKYSEGQSFLGTAFRALAETTVFVTPWNGPMTADGLDQAWRSLGTGCSSDTVPAVGPKLVITCRSRLVTELAAHCIPHKGARC